MIKFNNKLLEGEIHMAQKKIVSKKKVAKKKVVQKKPVNKKPEQSVANIHPMVGWIELNTTDTNKAKGFYSALFGWRPLKKTCLEWVNTLCSGKL